MRQRDREEIFASILSATGSGGRMTLGKIMFHSCLTHYQGLFYTSTLIEYGFLEYDSVDRTFKTTPSGFKFLESHNEMSEIFTTPQETRSRNEEVLGQ